MHEAIPSRSALRVALRRAAHQIYDPPPLVFPDPLAVPILGGERGEHGEALRKTATKLHKPHSVALRAFLVARSRYAEDTLAQAVHHGVTQYVLLGAGLDTFAHRNPHPNLRVFEVDHPATQAWKQELLTGANLPTPPRLTFVPLDLEDFERESLPQRLHVSGFDPTQPTFFAWLGVVPYLTLEAFRSTIAFIAAQPPGSGVVFDYGLPRAALPPHEQLARDSLAARVLQSGEPFQLFFTPAEVASELSPPLAAFTRIEDLGTPEINARYFPHHQQSPQPHLQLRGSSTRLLTAWL
ncbi:MAG TPA: class I SAM-dependent methyltransferase [Granulicella sp.]|nr:class I SAM-dependent methyltransferase [Granulicella sp.]